MSFPAGPPPLSPLSMSSNDSSFVGRYGSLGGGLESAVPTPSSDIPYTGGPYGAARPAQTSPPASQHPSSSTDMSRPSMGGSSVNGNRPPSSASSVGMSSDGRMGFGKPQSGSRDSSRGRMKPDGTDALERHYAALKTYLAAHLQAENGGAKPNRARDKLLRLSVTQFMELSTDVYDELIRREDERLGRLDNVPRFLLPKQNFHPKRNQARQKLSTLPPERFKQLATDVFYELERRIPRLNGPDGRPRSSASNVSSRSRTNSRAGMRPPPSPYGYGPGAGRGRGFPPPGMGGPPRPFSPGANGLPSPGMRRPSEAGSLGRPLPKHLQSNTIVPNKGTMVEDDEPSDDDAFGLEHVGSGISERDISGADKERLQAQEAEIVELREKVESLENQLMAKEQELDKGLTEDERGEWTALREELEQKTVDLEKANENLEQEMASLKASSAGADEVRMLRDQIDALRDQLGRQKGNTESSPSEERLRELEDDLSHQEQISNQVRDEATTYLREMRELSLQNDAAVEQEEKMATRISELERENKEWRQRYAKIKAQNKSLRASTMGLGLQTGFDSGSLVRQEGLISEGGLVRDTDVTHFQLAVDELLKVARHSSTDAMLDSVKNVVISVQSITSAVGTDGYPTPSPSPLGPDTNMQQAPSVGKLKTRVTGTANSLITATKQHAASHGLSPVALLDAAAGNLTSAVVELIKAVHIRPSRNADFQSLDVGADDDIGSFYNDDEDVMSPADQHNLQIPVPQSNHSRAVGGIGHNDEKPLPPMPQKKSANAGWFGWAGKRNGEVQDDQQHQQQSNSVNGASHMDDSDGEYDPYR